MASEQKRTQKQKFIDAAREAEADENEDAFKDKLKRLAKAEPKKEAPDK